MSTTTLQFTLSVNGILTDPDTNAVTIIAPGVVRTDTSAVVLAAPAAMTRVSAGVYTAAVTDPALGLTYRWSAQYARNGVTQTPQYTTAGTPAGAGTTATGYYASRTDLVNRRGGVNLLVDSDYDSLGTENFTVEQYWLTASDAWINRNWADVGRSVPIAPTDLDYASLFPAMTEVSACWTLAMLNQPRAPRDKQGNMTGQASEWLAYAQRLLNARITLWLQQGEAPSGGGNDVPVETYATPPSYDATTGILDRPITPWGY